MISRLRAAGYTVKAASRVPTSNGPTVFTVQSVDWASPHGFDLVVYKFKSAADLRRYEPHVVAATGRFPQANITAQAGRYLFVATSSMMSEICTPPGGAIPCPPPPNLSKKLIRNLIGTALAGSN